MACLIVIFSIVDLWQCCVCCTRSGVTRCTKFVALYLCLCASPGYTLCFDHTSVYLCASTLQNRAVPHDFYSPLSIPLERSGWPRIRWCGIGGFQEQVRCLFVGLVALSFFVFDYFPFLFISTIGGLCGAGIFGLMGCQSPSPSLALPIFFNNNNNNNNKRAVTIAIDL